MTIADRNKLDKRFKKCSHFARFIRNNINYTLGEKLLDVVYDRWDNSYCK